MNKDERNALINAIILMLYDDDSDALNIMLLQLEQYDVELATKISKKWLYSLLADIIGTSERTAYNKLSGASNFTSSELAALKNFFGGCCFSFFFRTLSFMLFYLFQSIFSYFY